ncbi:MAG: exosortase/archaeosortase family protein [Chlorobium sp.]|nr:MAG: exosortase/archaeosortase family protein [Chlorobium sp.]
MNLKPHASWFPWLLFALMTLHSAIRYTIFNPSFGNSDEPLLFVILVVVLWIERSSVKASLRGMKNGNLISGLALLGAGWALYTAGRLYPVMILEIWGLFCIAAGLVGTLAPTQYQRSSFFIALAGTIIVLIGWVAPELFSSELALAIADSAAKILTATILPVVSNGVTLYFGPYSAEVTKACSGMNSIFSLTALSVLYLRESAQRKPWHLLLLVACVLPVAVLTNLFRVIVLVLATNYIGDGFAQGFFHDATGIFVFLVALATLALIDHLLFHTYRGITQTEQTAHADQQIQHAGHSDRPLARFIAALGRNKGTSDL